MDEQREEQNEHQEHEGREDLPGSGKSFRQRTKECWAAFMEKEARLRRLMDRKARRAAGKEAVTFLGGASGIYCGYQDFIAWDVSAVLSAAAEFLKESPVEWAVFRSFRRDSEVIRLAEKQRFVLK